MEDNKCASLDYEKECDRLMLELDKARCEADYLRGECKQKDNELAWYYGFKNAVELIFGKGGCNA